MKSTTIKKARKNAKVNNSQLPLDSVQTGWPNIYSRMALQLKPQYEDIHLESEILPRVNQSALEPTKRDQFIEAFKIIIKNGQFADLVGIHTDWRYNIHSNRDTETNQRFLPWHRVFLYELEFRLNSTSVGNSKIRIPYWDWTVDRDIPDWLKNFRPRINDVPVIPDRPAPPVPVMTTIPVERRPGRAINPRTGRPFELPTKAQVDRLSTLTTFLDFTAELEGIHGLPHIWIGGTMASWNSPADPCFWLHHSNIDRLWDLWPHSQAERPGLQGANAEMIPWSYRTDRDRIEDTKIFGYTYK
jgi:tyrosinase